MWKFQHNPTIFLGGRAHKLHKKGHFMKAASIQKHLKIYNFTTIDVILMKLTRIMYLCNSFLLTGTWAVTQKQHSTTEKHLKGSQKVSFLAHFWPFLKITKKTLYILYCTSQCITGWTFKEIWVHLQELGTENHLEAA